MREGIRTPMLAGVLLAGALGAAGCGQATHQATGRAEAAGPEACVRWWNASADARAAAAADWRAGRRAALVTRDAAGRCVVALDPRGAHRYFGPFTPALPGAWTWRRAGAGWTMRLAHTRQQERRERALACALLARLRRAPNAAVGDRSGRLRLGAPRS